MMAAFAYFYGYTPAQYRSLTVTEFQDLHKFMRDVLEAGGKGRRGR